MKTKPKFLLTALLAITSALAGGDHGEEEPNGLVILDAEQSAALHLGSYRIQVGSLQDVLEYPVELQFDPNHVAHLTPRVSGVVSQVRFGLGDRVKKGAVLAVLESRELGLAGSTYLAALSHQTLREKTYAREKRLWEKKISAEQDYLEADTALQEARIKTEMARQTLLALGLSANDLTRLGTSSSSLNRYEMIAPFDGVITAQHMTLGELLKDESKALILVDPARVWAMARIYERDIRKVTPGRKALITIQAFPGETFSGDIDYVGHQVDEESRTVAARVVLPNPEGKLRAGMFGNLALFVEEGSKSEEGFLLPHTALQRSEGGFVAFKQLAAGRFQQVHVQLLAKGKDFVQVVGPLSPGDRVATGDTFVLKALAAKDEMGGGHAH